MILPCKSEPEIVKVSDFDESGCKEYEMQVAAPYAYEVDPFVDPGNLQQIIALRTERGFDGVALIPDARGNVTIIWQIKSDYPADPDAFHMGENDVADLLGET